MIDKEFISNSYKNIIKNIDGKANLLAVSKYQPIDKIKYLSSLGQTDFGENYSQELEEKALLLPNLNWHFIGSIQSRKIKNIVKYASSIQSVEKLEHLEKINQAASSSAKNIDVFLQINIDNDPNKSGFKTSEQTAIKECIFKAKDLKNIKLVGLMCIPKKTNAPDESFKKMKAFFDQLNSKLSKEHKLIKLSMGMSSDYETAINLGSTDVRIGSSLFGSRLEKN